MAGTKQTKRKLREGKCSVCGKLFKVVAMFGPVAKRCPKCACPKKYR